MVTSQNIQNSGETEKADIQKREKDYTLTIAVLLVIIHFVFHMAYFEPAISTPDANGYFVQAKLIAKEHRTYFKTESIIQYVGDHWHKTGNNGYFSEYPPGFPAILAVVFWIFGPEATLLVNPLMASVSLFALFLTCRVWIGRWWGLLAAALMAFNPIANQHALVADSHTATLFFLIWALYFIARWNNTHSLWWSFGTGLFLGIIPTIRYPEVLFTIAFGLFLMLNLRGDRTVWRSLIAGVIGFALPFGTLCIRNHLAFGAFWKTGYSLLNRPIGFGWNYFITHSIHYLQELQSEGCGLMFGLGLIGIAALCARRDTWKRSIFWAVLILPITLLYMAYFWPPDHASMRFLLPTFPVYTIASVWLLQMLSENQRKAAYVGSAVLLFFMISWGLPLSIQPMKNLKSTNAALVQVTRALKNHAEPGSIVIANKHILQHIDFVGYWHLADELVYRARPFQLRFDDNNVDETIQQRR
ncbi:MAG TPA: glycosyltransferase family 39 protein, partial [Anaerolineae bacterium]|nr:glycosyltransferase family 39 protein [Anaerolineae bacterium]